jgi:Flp pilus assembly protein TadG
MPSARLIDRLLRLAPDEAGATAAEFALVLPGVALLTIGTIYLGLMMYASNCLHYAAEDAARCASVNPTVCTSATTTQTYARGRYKGPGTPSFPLTTPACGKQVAATLSYSLITGLATITVPISATACYPLP